MMSAAAIERKLYVIAPIRTPLILVSGCDWARSGRFTSAREPGTAVASILPNSRRVRRLSRSLIYDSSSVLVRQQIPAMDATIPDSRGGGKNIIGGRDTAPALQMHWSSLNCQTYSPPV